MFAALSFAVAAGAWGMRRVVTPVAVAASVVGTAVLVGGTVTGVDGYPWSNVVVTGTAIAVGVVVGRWVPARARPMLVLLAVLSVLDTAQLLVGGGGERPAWETWFHVLVLTGDGTTILEIGVVDLVLVAALAEHWRRRGAGFWLATLTGPLGLALSAVYAWLVRPEDGLVLVPFLLAGWVLSEIRWQRRRGRRPIR